MTSVDVNTGTRPDYEPSFRDRHMLMFSVCTFFFSDRRAVPTPQGRVLAVAVRSGSLLPSPATDPASRDVESRARSGIWEVGITRTVTARVTSEVRSAMQDAPYTQNTHAHTHTAHSTVSTRVHAPRTSSGRIAHAHACAPRRTHRTQRTHTYPPPLRTAASPPSLEPQTGRARAPFSHHRWRCRWAAALVRRAP